MQKSPEQEPKDVFGRPFPVPVNADHKATTLKFWDRRTTCSLPHMRAFHASWFGFFATFFSTFAPAPLMPYIRTSLKLSREASTNAGLASLGGCIAFRMIMGAVCDRMGARKGLASLLLLTTPAILGMMFVTEQWGFLFCRLVIGCSLASFVACQVWCSQQFAPSIVGIANATSGGWGNLGGGVQNLLMPTAFMGLFLAITNNDPDLSWRLCFIVPLLLHLSSAALALTGRDLPDGNFAELELSGAKQKSDLSVVLKVGLSNINAWILTITYAMCFGVELTMTNVAPTIFHDFFAQSVGTAGILASIFGLVNIFGRSCGGILSDCMNAKFGFRGRIWSLWITQTLQGVIMIGIGLVTIQKTAPDFAAEEAGTATYIPGWVQDGDTWHEIPGSKILQCGAAMFTLTEETKALLPPSFAQARQVVLSEAPQPWANGDDCVSNTGSLGAVVALFFLFSLCVQMAEGLSFGLVPFVSRPALGVVSGLVGAGGNAGGVATTKIFFAGIVRPDKGFIDCGIAVIALTSLLFFFYIPEYGSMLTGKNSLGSYDAQLIKPPAGYRGADSMDYANVDPSATATTTKTETETSKV